MTPTTGPKGGSIDVAALVGLGGAGLVAGPVVAQEATADGASGNETADDDSTTGEEVDDETMPDDEMGTETMGDDSTTGEEVVNEGGGEQVDEGGGEQVDEETTPGGQPGFGVVALTAVVATAAFVHYRRRG